MQFGAFVPMVVDGATIAPMTTIVVTKLGRARVGVKSVSWWAMEGLAWGYGAQTPSVLLRQ